MKPYTAFLWLSLSLLSLGAWIYAVIWSLPTPGTAKVLSAWTSQTNPTPSPTVTRVVDGDTIELSDGRIIRYIGIDTPELHHPKKKVECFAQQAKRFNEEKVLNQPVELELDVRPLDRYGRTLAYIYVDDVLINELLVTEGYAQAVSYPPNVKYQERLKAGKQEAREQVKGLWQACPIKK